MNREQVWKNFDLGRELDISGAFVYNGLRRFHEMSNLDNPDDIFEVLYGLSIGLERILKVTLVFLEHNDDVDQAEFEESLITHNHLELLKRVRAKRDLPFGDVHVALLELLRSFYKSGRYDRFTLAPAWNPDKEKKALHTFLERELQVSLEPEWDLMPVRNEPRYRTFLGKTALKVARELFKIISAEARILNLYTYELRSGSKAQWVFLRDRVDFQDEDVLLKELLLFFMNTDDDAGLIGMMREVEPLDFDPALAVDYFDCFRSAEKQEMAIDELEEHYVDIEDVGDRLELMSVIGNPNVQFPDEEDDEFED